MPKILLRIVALVLWLVWAILLMIACCVCSRALMVLGVCWMIHMLASSFDRTKALYIRAADAIEKPPTFIPIIRRFPAVFNVSATRLARNLSAAMPV